MHYAMRLEYSVEMCVLYFDWSDRESIFGSVDMSYRSSNEADHIDYPNWKDPSTMHATYHATNLSHFNPRFYSLYVLSDWSTVKV